MRSTFTLLVISLLAHHGIKGQSFSKGNTIGSTNFVNGASAWGDADNDGDMDLVLMGTPSNISTTKFYINNNDGTFSENHLANLGDGDLEWEDYNNDGYLDLLVSGLDNTVGGNGLPETNIYKNMGDGNFQKLNDKFINVYQGSVSWVDFNNDGKKDFLVSGRVNTEGNIALALYKNIGNDQFEYFPVPFQAVSQSDIKWADFDNDGYLDVVIAGYDGSYGSTRVYRNLGNETFELHQHLTIAMRGSIGFGDYNNDGQIDLVVSGFSGIEQTLKVYKNNSGTFMEIVDAEFVGGEQGATQWIDYDNDGNLDIVSSLIGDGVWKTRLYHNNGNDDFTLVDNSGLPDDFSPVTLVDIDKDGDLDLFFPSTFNANNAMSFYINNSGTINASPNTPTLHTEEVSEAFITFSWEGSSDPEISGSVTYNIFVVNEGDTIVTPNSLVNGKRKVLKEGNAQFGHSYSLSNYPPGDYTYSVQAVDNGFNASAFAATNSFHINFPPIIKGLQEPVSTNEDTPLTISPDQLVIEDPDNTNPGDFTLTLLAGANYTISGNEITPKSNLNGPLTIRVSVNDGKDESEVFQFQIEVVPVNDAPVITGTTKSLLTPENNPLSISIIDLIIEDPDNTFASDFTLLILEGDNYSTTGNTLIPADGFLGTLSVSLVVSDGVDDSAPFSTTVEVTKILSAETNPSERFKVYPNPTSEAIHLSGGETFKSVTLLDAKGQIVNSTQMTISSEKGNTIISMKSLQNGVYFLIIETASEIISEKVIISH